ncbi:MAG: SHOCT domain-containing protein [Candidatus Omnitrophota bacterium]|nr:SHOCT domain-containing protein [Candidatus Omnitrophota bacterium]
MRKTVLFLGVPVILLLLFTGLVHSQSMEEMKAGIRAQVKRDMGITDDTGGHAMGERQPRDTVRREHVARKVSFNLDPGDLDLETVLQTMIILMFLAFIPATIAHFKGRNFFLWWLLGVLFFIIALPVVIFLKKKDRSSRARKTAAKEAAQETEDGPGPAENADLPEKTDPVKTGSSKDTAIDIYEKIEKLARLKEKGIFSEKEFNAKKKELLDRI